MFTGRKLPLTLAFTAVIALASGVSCNGFFVDPALTGIAISPLTPQVEEGKTLQLSVFGTYDDGSRKQIKSGINWSTNPVNIVSIDPKTNIMTGVSAGTTTLSVDVQALAATATATVFVVITGLSITPLNPSANQGETVNFTIKDQNNNNVSNLAHVVAQQGGNNVTTINCSFDDVNNVQACAIDSSAPTGRYTIVATYPGFNGSVSTNLTVTAP